jgi:hypothetical protein
MELEALAWKVKAQRVGGRSGLAAARRFAEELATAWGEGVVLGTAGVQGVVEHAWLYVPSLGLHVDMGSPAGVPRWIDLQVFSDCARVAAVEEAGVLQVGAIDPTWDGDGGLLCSALRLTVERLDAAALSERVHARCGWEYEAAVGGLWIEDLVWPWFPIDPTVVDEVYRLALGAWGVDRALEDEPGEGESIWAVASDLRTVDVLRGFGFEEAGKVPCRVMVKR